MNSITDIPSITDHSIEVSNRLLCGEISALASYDQAIGNEVGSPMAEEFRRIQSDHEFAIQQLSAKVRETGGVPETHPRARWARISKNREDSKSILEWLKIGEEARRRDYQDALLDDDVMKDLKLLIRDELLPQVIQHVASLENFEQPAA